MRGPGLQPLPCVALNTPEIVTQRRSQHSSRDRLTLRGAEAAKLKRQIAAYRKFSSIYVIRGTDCILLSVQISSCIIRPTAKFSANSGENRLKNLTKRLKPCPQEATMFSTPIQCMITPLLVHYVNVERNNMWTFFFLYLQCNIIRVELEESPLANSQITRVYPFGSIKARLYKEITQFSVTN